VKLWDARTGQETLTLKGHTREVTSVAFSPDGARLASGSADNTVKLWDARTGQETLTLKGHTNGVTSVAFSPDGARSSAAGSLGMNVTIISSGKVTITQAANGENQVKVEVGGSGGRLQRHTTAKPYSLETNGAIVESFGPAGVTLEILDYSEYQQRFPQLAVADSAHAAAGFCLLKQNLNGTY
jgi:dipeptidyl aminopeptidase/acylaminoacyl peptidase